MKTILFLFFFLFVSLRAAPPTPVISEVFESNVALEVEITGVHYFGFGQIASDQPKGKLFEHLEFPRNPSLTQEILARYDLGALYILHEFHSCEKEAVNGTLQPYWGWVANATYNGSRTEFGRTLDIWVYTMGYATNGIVVDSARPDIPVYYWRHSPARNFSVVFEDFMPSIQRTDIFDVPHLCQQTITKNVGCVSRTTMIADAQVWVNARVPYNQGATYDGYREDCSGYVSMAWQLAKPGYTTSTLPQVAHRITKAELLPGDVLLDVSEHVVLFGGWANSAQTEYVAYEETRPGEGTVKRVTPYPYWYNTASFLPYRYNGAC